MKLLPVLPVLAGALLCSCSTSRVKQSGGIVEGVAERPVKVDELATALHGPGVSFKKVRVTAFYHPGGMDKTSPLGAVDLRPGRVGKLAYLQEFPYPTDFDFAVPGTGQVQGDSGFRPTTPRRFKNRPTGETLEITATPKGAYIMLEGKMTVSQCERLVYNSGKLFGPVLDRNGDVLSDNRLRSPLFTDRVTHFMTVVRPGPAPESATASPEDGSSSRSVAVRLNSDRKDACLNLHVEIADR